MSRDVPELTMVHVDTERDIRGVIVSLSVGRENGGDDEVLAAISAKCGANAFSARFFESVIVVATCQAITALPLSISRRIIVGLSVDVLLDDVSLPTQSTDVILDLPRREV